MGAVEGPATAHEERLRMVCASGTWCVGRFLLPALTLYLPLKAAVPVGSFLFAVHHMNPQVMAMGGE